MANIPEIIKVDLSHFPTDKRFVQIPNKVVLTDNITEEFHIEHETQHPSFPVQVTTAVCLICVSGKMDVKIDLNDYTLTDGYTAVILPNSFFQMTSIEKGTKCIFMAISTDFINFNGDIKVGMEFGRTIRENPIHKPNEEELDETITVYKLMKKKLKQEEYLYKEEYAKSCLQIMYCNIFQTFITASGIQQEARPTSRKEELFHKFIKIVKTNYMENRSIQFYADKLFVSPKYLSSIIHEVSGKYATDWINDYVILEAKAMLRVEGNSIKDVSNNLNFANQSFFAKYFKQHTGYTPKEYKSL